MFCTNCGKLIDNDSKFCPYCAAKVEVEPKPEAPSAKEDAVQAQNTQPQQQYAQPQQQYAQPQAPSPENQVSGAKTKVKKPGSKKKKGIIAIVIAAVVAVVALVTAFSFSRLTNLFARSFMKPDSYYQYVEKKNSKTMAENISAIYGNDFLESVIVTGGKGRMSMYVDIDNKARELLKEQTGMDFSWLKKAEFVLEGNVKDEKTALTLELVLNGQSIASVDVIEDSENGDIFGRIPFISDEYFSASLSDIYGNELGAAYDDLFENSEKIKEALPDSKTLEKILTRYIEIALESVNEADKGSSELSASGVSATYNTIEINIDDEICQNVVKNICKEIVKDKDIKKIINNIEKATEQDLYDDFIDSINELEDDADNIKLSEDIKMILWVNGKGEVVGREITIGNSRFKYAMPESGKDFGFELSYKQKVDGKKFTDIMSVSGSGTRSGSKINGTFVLKTTQNSYVDYEAESETLKVMNVKVKDYDTEKAKEGNINGTFTFKLERDYVDLLNLPDEIKPLLTGAAIQIKIASSANKSDIKLSFSIDGDNYISLGIAYSEESKSDAIPSVSDAVDIQELMQNINWVDIIEKLRDNLEKAGVPSEVIDSLMIYSGASGINNDDWGTWDYNWDYYGDDWDW